MAATKTHAHVDRAERHAIEAERLLRGRLISSHVKAQVRAALALYCLTRSCDRGRVG